MENLWKTCGKLLINNVDNINIRVYNRGITIKERITMRLADEIEKINHQSKQIKEIRKDISEIMKDMDV